jgi:hypothetical protein
MIIAIDRSSFNYIFKYNSMTISLSQVLDLRNEILENEIQKTSSFIVSEFDRILPIFELDHEVLLLEIQKSELEINGRIHLPFNSILKVYPLTGKAKNLLSGKLNQSIEIGEAIFEAIIEEVKLNRSINNRKILFNKLLKICLLKQNPSFAFCQKVESIVELLLKNQSAGNSYLANLIQYNYNPNEISSGNIEFLEKIGVIAWITSKSSSEGYTNSNYYKRCEEFKSKINEGDYISGYLEYLNIIENSSPEFKISHNRIKEISNEGQIEIDLFKASYYFLAIKTKLNKNNSNLLDLFEDLIRDIHSDPITMSHVLYLVAYSFSFEQLYESVHILERSALLKSKFITRDAQTILNDLEKEKIKQLKDEEERIRIEEEERLKTESVERNRLFEEEQLKAEADEKIRLEQELIIEEEMELDDERINMLIQSHTPVDDNESSSDSNLLETKNEEIEIGKTIELNPHDNSEKVNVQDWKNSDDSTKNENEGFDLQESNSEVSEPSLEYQNSENNKLDNHLDKDKEVKSENSDDLIDNKEINSDNPNLQKNGYKEDNAVNEVIKDNILVEKPKRGKSTRPKTMKIIQRDKSFSDSEVNFSNIEDSKSQNLEINPNQSNDEKITSLTVEIFESFLLEFLKSSLQNKEKVKLWTDLMSTYFKEPSMEITLDILMAQMKYKPYSKDLMFESESEIELIENFFKTYNQ